MHTAYALWKPAWQWFLLDNKIPHMGWTVDQLLSGDDKHKFYFVRREWSKAFFLLSSNFVMFDCDATSAWQTNHLPTISSFDCDFIMGEMATMFDSDLFWGSRWWCLIVNLQWGREDMFVCELSEVVMMFDWDFTLGDADMAVRVGCGDVGEPGEDVNGNHLGGKMRMMTIMMRIGEKRKEWMWKPNNL